MFSNKSILKTFFLILVLVPSTVFAIDPIYFPGETLTPTCAPTDPGCSVSTSTLPVSIPATFPSFTYASGTYYFASNPSSYITLNSLLGTAPITYSSTTGTINITQASSTSNGYLSATDWATFNGKQNALTNPVTGTGTVGQIAVFNAASGLASLPTGAPGTFLVASSTSPSGYDWTTNGNGIITSLTVASANGFSGSFTGGATPALTIVAGAITPTSVNGLSFATTSSGFTISTTSQALLVIGSSTVSGSFIGTFSGTSSGANTGDESASTIRSKIGAATSTNDGYLSSSDWSVFNGKQNALGFTPYNSTNPGGFITAVSSEALSNKTGNISMWTNNTGYITASSSDALSNKTGNISMWTNNSGYITASSSEALSNKTGNVSMWTNNSNYITLNSISGSAPIKYSSSTGAISITQAATAANGYLSSTDWNTFNNKAPTASPTFTGSAVFGTVGSDIMPTTPNTYSIGTTTNAWANIVSANVYSNLGLFNQAAVGAGGLDVVGTIYADTLNASGTINTQNINTQNISVGNGVTGLTTIYGSLQLANNMGNISPTRYLSTDASGNVILVNDGTSDERLKNIQGSYDKGLNDIMKINPINYKWRSGTRYDTVNVYSGFSAQNMQLAIPEAVGTDTDGFLYITDRPVTAALVNSVKQIGSFINKIEGGIAYLKNIVVGKLTIGSDVSPAGITMYDRTTKQPYCVSVNNGVMSNEPGECSDTPVVNNTASVASSIDNTPVIVPEEQSSSTPSDNASTTESDISTSTPEVPAESISTSTDEVVSSESTTTEQVIVPETPAEEPTVIEEVPPEIVPEVTTPIEVFLAPEPEVHPALVE